MAGYFSYFNKIPYNLEDNNTSAKLVTDILQRSAFLKEVAENTAVAYDYIIQDGDTPEIMAHKLYGDSNRHWIILLFNKMINPQYDFPLDEKALVKYIQNKHDMSIEDAKSIKYYTRKIVERTISTYGTVKYRNKQTYKVPEYVVTDYDTGAIVSGYPVTIGESTTTVTVDADELYPVVGETYTETLADGSTIEETVTLEGVSYYTHEIEENDARRKIKLLDAAYAPRVEEEFRKLMSNG